MSDFVGAGDDKIWARSAQ